MYADYFLNETFTTTLELKYSLKITKHCTCFLIFMAVSLLHIYRSASLIVCRSFLAAPPIPTLLQRHGRRRRRRGYLRS